jgi:hypothetical protein
MRSPLRTFPLPDAAKTLAIRCDPVRRCSTLSVAILTCTDLSARNQKLGWNLFLVSTKLAVHDGPVDMVQSTKPRLHLHPAFSPADRVQMPRHRKFPGPSCTRSTVDVKSMLDHPTKGRQDPSAGVLNFWISMVVICLGHPNAA